MTTSVRSDVAPDTIVPLILGLAAKKPKGKPVIVAVAGGSGDGKGYLIERLVERLNAARGGATGAVSVLPLDNYYIGRARMRDAGVPHFDCPEALDLAMAAGDLASACTGKIAKIPTYDFPSGERAGTTDFFTKSIILVDGLFALRPEILAVADLKIFVRSDHYSSMLRRLFRDAGPAGRTKQSSREVLDQYFTTVWPAKKRYIDPTADRADVIVESQYDPLVEARRAGPIQYQLKARGYRPDDHMSALCGAVRLGSSALQVDRFIEPKARAHQGELLRLRVEGGAVLLTYKGPFLATTPGARPATSPIELPMDAITSWFTDDYAPIATFEKSRTLFQVDDIIVARDDVKGLGAFTEVRATDEARLPKMRALLGKLCPKEPVLTQSYLELWKARAPISSAT